MPTKLPHIWIPGVIESIARFVPHNDVTTSLRLVDKASGSILRGHTTILLSESTRPELFCERWAAQGATRAMTREQRKLLLCLTAASGSVANLEVALEAAGLFSVTCVFEAASGAGHRHVVEMLQCRGFRLPTDAALRAAAAQGRRDMCAWLLVPLRQKKRARHSWQYQAKMLRELRWACYEAGRAGHVDLLEWLLREFREWLAPVGDPDPYPEGARVVVSGATQGCLLGVLQRLHGEWLPRTTGMYSAIGSRVPEAREDLVDCAARSLTPDWREKVEWLEEQEGRGRTRRRSGPCSSAVRCPDAVDRLRWLRQRGYKVDARGLCAAMEAGNAAAAQYLLTEARVRVSKAAFITAAEHGRLDELRTMLPALGSGRGDAARALLWAALRGGQVHVATWVVEALHTRVRLPPSPSSEAETAVARVLDWVYEEGEADSGSLDVLTWLQQRGYVWRHESLRSAARSGSVAAVEWLAENGCPMPTDGRPYLLAARHNDLAMLRCLRSVGCPWGPSRACMALDEDDEPWLVDGDLDGGVEGAVMDWLREQGCPMPTEDDYPPPSDEEVNEWRGVDWGHR